MTTQTEVLKLALEALKDAARHLHPAPKQNEAITAIKEALAHPEQTVVTLTMTPDPLAQQNPEQYRAYWNAMHPDMQVAQQSNEQVDQRLELIGHADLAINNIYIFSGYGEEVPEGRTPIYAGYKNTHTPVHTAQPEQEPVAWVHEEEIEELKECNGMSLWAENAAIHTEDSISKQLKPSGYVPLYTTPPQRKPQFKEFIKWAGAQGYDCAQTCNSDTGEWIVLNPMTADLWKAWQAAHGIKE